MRFWVKCKIEFPRQARRVMKKVWPVKWLNSLPVWVVTRCLVIRIGRLSVVLWKSSCSTLRRQDTLWVRAWIRSVAWYLLGGIHISSEWFFSLQYRKNTLFFPLFPFSPIFHLTFPFFSHNKSSYFSDKNDKMDSKQVIFFPLFPISNYYKPNFY